jgi:signal transduction histidine kinase
MQWEPGRQRRCLSLKSALDRAMINSPATRTRKVTPHRLAMALAAATTIIAIGTLLGLIVALGTDFAVAATIAGLILIVICAAATVIMQRASAPTEFETGARSDRDCSGTTEAATVVSAKFIADASHDLRQPLHALGLFLDALERRVTPGEGEKILSRTREAAAAVARTFDALVDLARIEADAPMPNLERFGVDTLLTNIPRNFSDIAPAAGVAWRIVHSRAQVVGDERMIGHVLKTLLSNLIELGPGRLLLGPRRRGGQLWLEAHCSRPGRPSTKWEVLRVPSSATLATGRSALELDLVVARRMTDLLGLELRVTTTDRGTVLALSLS